MSYTRDSLMADCHRKQRDFPTDILMHELLGNCEEQLRLDSEQLQRLNTDVEDFRSLLLALVEVAESNSLQSISLDCRILLARCRMKLASHSMSNRTSAVLLPTTAKGISNAL